MKNDVIPCIVSSFNSKTTKASLKSLNIQFKEYPFISSFYLEAGSEQLYKISNIKSVKELTSVSSVSTMICNVKDNINLTNITENQYFGNKVTIAFIDTGIMPHIDFLYPKNRIKLFIDLINHKTFPYDDNGHGTFVASICAGSGKRFQNTYSGIAKYSNIISIKALNKKGETDSNIILDAMQYVYDHHKELNIKIVCMSFGANYIGNNDPLKRGAQALWDKGIVVVAAAGNSGPKEKSIKSPGVSSKIITVGGLDTTKIDFAVADFSSRGPVGDRFKPDLIAPSVEITGASISPNTPYIKMSGTSVATPIVAGICAIILEKYPDIQPDRIKYFLTKHCKTLTKNKNIEGFGYINF